MAERTENSPEDTTQNNLHNQDRTKINKIERIARGLCSIRDIVSSDKIYGWIVMSLGLLLIILCVHKFVEREQDLQSLLAEKERIVTQLQRFLPAASYTCNFSGPGLLATANYSTYVIIELRDPSGQPCLFTQNVTAELQPVDHLSVIPTNESMKSPSQYEASYKALSRRQHKFHVQLNGSDVNCSPSNIDVNPDPTQLGTPAWTFTELNKPWGIAINSLGDVMVSNFEGHLFTLLDREGKKNKQYKIPNSIPAQTMHTTGIAVDRDDNVYVASGNKLHKFSVDSQRWSKGGKLGDPKGIVFHQGCVYVCDRANNHIQVFDTDLKFIRTIGSFGSGKVEFDEPYDLDFDSEGNAYVSDRNNHRIQVINTRGHGRFIRQFGQEEGEGKLRWPTAVHILGMFVYISDWDNNRIAVYETSGHFVKTFGT